MIKGSEEVISLLGFLLVAHQKDKKGNLINHVKQSSISAPLVLMEHLFLLDTSHTLCSSTEVVLLRMSYCTEKNTKKDLCSFRKVGTIISSLRQSCHIDL